MKARNFANMKWKLIMVIIVAFMAFVQQTQAQRVKRGQTKVNEISVEDILKKYESFEEVDLIQNKVGISLGVSMFIEASYSNPAFNNDENNIYMCNNKFHLKDAVSMIDIDTNVGKMIIEDKNNNDELLNKEFRNYFQIRNMPSNTKFIIVCFDGITKSENEELETPPLFFLVQRGEKGSVVLTKTPKLLGDLLKSE